MRRPWMLLAGGLLLALLAYFGFYYAGTASSRKLEHSPAPELAWLKQEFHLGDAEYARLCQMHEGYVEGCAERCRRIDEVNAQLKERLGSTNTMTPEIEQTLLEAARLHAECQKQMLQHFYDVSRMMPADQGKRYLSWVQAQTIPPDMHSRMGHAHMQMDGR